MTGPVLAPSVTGVVVVPSAPLLLPEHAGQVDAVPELRAAIRETLSGLPVGEVALLPEPRWGERVGRFLLADAGLGDRVAVSAARALVVVGDGSARRTEKAPGYLDDRAAGFDAAIEDALRSGDAGALAAVDVELGQELLAAGAGVLRVLGGAVVESGRAVIAADLAHAADPFGVRYWVARWQLG